VGRPRRVIAKIEHHLGELFPRVGFIVTTLSGTNRAVVRFYNQRGTAEQWIKEGKEATHWTRLSCHRFRANEVRLLLGVIAYNLGNLLRRLVLPAAIQTWSRTSLQQRLFKTGGRLIRHGWYFTLQLAESYLTGGASFGRFFSASSDSPGIRRDGANCLVGRKPGDEGGSLSEVGGQRPASAEWAGGRRSDPLRGARRK
jgi:Transposase DDE domain group 1